jgi:hypothetical protein
MVGKASDGVLAEAAHEITSRPFIFPDATGASSKTTHPAYLGANENGCWLAT